MGWYVDTSAFVKLVVAERQRDALARVGRGARGRSVQLRPADDRGAPTARRHSPDALERTRAALDALTLVRLSPEVLAHTADLDPAILRSLDALHLAAALEPRAAIWTGSRRMTTGSRPPPRSTGSRSSHPTDRPPTGRRGQPATAAASVTAAATSSSTGSVWARPGNITS